MSPSAAFYNNLYITGLRGIINSVMSKLANKMVGAGETRQGQDVEGAPLSTLPMPAAPKGLKVDQLQFDLIASAAAAAVAAQGINPRAVPSLRELVDDSRAA